MSAGEKATFTVCADLAALEGEDGPASGILVAGPAGAPTLLQMDVTWTRQMPTVFLPTAAKAYAMQP